MDVKKILEQFLQLLPYSDEPQTNPTGPETGDKQRIKGKGIKNSSTGKTGDMYIIFKVVTPSKLTREQKNLFEKLMDTDMSNSYTYKFDRFVKRG